MRKRRTYEDVQLEIIKLARDYVSEGWSRSSDAVNLRDQFRARLKELDALAEKEFLDDLERLRQHEVTQ